MARPPITSAKPWTPTRGQFAGQTFTTERQYRNALARAKGFPSWDVQRRAASKVVRSRATHEALKPAERLAHGKALDALSRMRSEGLPIKLAARAAETTIENVLKYVGSALTRGTRNRYVPKASDRLFRPMQVVTGQGVVPIDVRDSRSASKIARHHNAIRHYLTTGDTSQLREFRRSRVFSGKRGHRLASDLDLDLLNLHARAGELSFEHIYQLVA